MSSEFNLAGIPRKDLTPARKAWLAELKHAKRTETDFLSPVNHDGKRLDFHALRHTCGAWFCLDGENPKVVQTVMRHSTITLTMDTYDHLLQDSHSNAIASMGKMMDLSAASVAVERPPVVSNGNQQQRTRIMRRAGRNRKCCRCKENVRKMQEKLRIPKVPPVGLEPTTR